MGSASSRKYQSSPVLSGGGSSGGRNLQSVAQPTDQRQQEKETKLKVQNSDRAVGLSEKLEMSGKSASNVTLRSDYSIKSEDLHSNMSAAGGSDRAPEREFKKVAMRVPTPWPVEDPDKKDKPYNRRRKTKKKEAETDERLPGQAFSSNKEKLFRTKVSSSEKSVLREWKEDGLLKVNNLDICHKEKEELARNILVQLRDMGIAVEEGGDRDATMRPPPRLESIDSNNASNREHHWQEIDEAEDLLDDIDLDIEKTDEDFVSRNRERFLLQSSSGHHKLARIPEETGSEVASSPKAANKVNTSTKGKLKVKGKVRSPQKARSGPKVGETRNMTKKTLATGKDTKIKYLSHKDVEP